MASNDLLVDTYGPGGIGFDILPFLSSAFRDGVLPVKTVWETITRFPYMPRLADQDVLDRAIEGAPDIVWDPQERFALASGRDSETGRFRNLVIPGITNGNQHVQITDSTLIVDWDKAMAAYTQYEHELEESNHSIVDDSTKIIVDQSSSVASVAPSHNPDTAKPLPPVQPQPAAASKKRYFATIELDPDRLSRELAQIDERILDQLRMTRANIMLSLEIQADNPHGFADDIMRIVNENAKSLKFDDSSFEEE